MNQRDKGQTDSFVIGFIVSTVVIIALIVGLVMLVGGTWSETNSSTMTCVFNGGPLDDNNFTGYEEPGVGRNYQGFMSTANNVPTGLRQYRVSLDPGQGDVPAGDSIDVRVKGYDMKFEPTATFTLNTLVRDGKPVSCDFIEKQLRQFDATDFDNRTGNWIAYLNERFRPILNDVAARVLQQGDPGDLKFNIGGARDAAAKQIGIDLKTALEASFGKDYFCDSTYQFGGDADECGNSLTIILPEPKLADPADEAQLSKPQRAKIDADNEIAAAQENARKAKQVAEAKATEADSAKTLADANEQIANENARVLKAQAANDYAWCEFVSSLGQDCALVKAAENNDYPDVVTAGETAVAVPVP